MRKAQFNAIEKFSQNKIVKVIDENFEKPPSIVIYAQEEQGESILEYLVSPSGTIELSTSYAWNSIQQKFFDKAPSLRESVLEPEA